MHAIENTVHVGNTINATCARGMMGKLDIIQSNIRRLRCILIGCIFFSWHKYMYLLQTEFEVRTVSYGLSFSPFDLWPKREARGP